MDNNIMNSYLEWLNDDFIDQTTKDELKSIENKPEEIEDRFYQELEFGTAGADGIFTWNGNVSVYANGAGVDEVRKMTLTLSSETEIVFA